MINENISRKENPMNRPRFPPSEPTIPEKSYIRYSSFVVISVVAKLTLITGVGLSNV